MRLLCVFTVLLVLIEQCLNFANSKPLRRHSTKQAHLSQHHTKKHQVQLLQNAVQHIDSNSHANFNEIVTEHVHFDALINFEEQVVTGTQTLTLRVLRDTIKYIDLDVWNLKIFRVVDGHFKVMHFELLQEFDSDVLGEKLRIHLPYQAQNIGHRVKITIDFETTSHCKACYWHTAEQTRSRRLNYLYTICQPAYCRSLAPFQDTPSVKSTYTAKVTVLQPYSVYMSAYTKEIKFLQQNVVQYEFEQKKRIPSYLFSLSVGDLEERIVGYRTSVVAENGSNTLKAAQSQDVGGQLEKYIAVIENLTRVSYEWQHYGLLIMPDSFAFGGMETPYFSMLTSSILYGDAYQFNIILHEIAHSWAGNQVTCSNWTHFWLNEGLTTYLEQKAVLEVAGEDAYRLNCYISQQQLNESIKQSGVDHPYTALSPQLRGVNPDDAYNLIPYEKGFAFFLYLEHEIFKDFETMQNFLQEYFTEFDDKSVSIEDFQIFLKNFCRKGQHPYASIDWKQWFIETGYPPYYADFTTHNKFLEQAKALVHQYLGLKYAKVSDWEAIIPYSDYLPMQKSQFFKELRFHKKHLTEEIIKKLEQELDLLNESVQFKCYWIGLTLEAGYEKHLQLAKDLLIAQQSTDIATALYRGIIRSGHYGEAIALYQQQKAYYHFVQTEEFDMLFIQEAIYFS